MNRRTGLLLIFFFSMLISGAVFGATVTEYYRTHLQQEVGEYIYVNTPQISLPFGYTGEAGSCRHNSTFGFKNWNSTALTYTVSIVNITVEGDLEIGDVYENLTVFIIERGDPVSEYVLELDVLNPAGRIGTIELEADELVVFDLVVFFNVSALLPYRGEVEVFTSDVFKIAASFDIKLAT